MIHAALRDAALLFAARRAPVVALAATTAGVIAVDEISKALALYLLPALDAPTRFLELGVLLNDDLGWGLSAGAGSVTITAVVALMILGLSFLVCGALAKHDHVAPVMLGLIVGAGIANATDALTAPAGVVDWIAIGGIVMNLADGAVVVGLVLCARTLYRLVVAIRAGDGLAEERKSDGVQ